MYQTYFQPYTPAIMQPLSPNMPMQQNMPVQQIMQTAQQAPMQQNVMPISQPTQQTPSLAIRANYVSCREEAIAAQVPFDNTLTVFVDKTNNCIYTKQFDAETGESNFTDYFTDQQIEKPVPKIVPKTKYVERSEFTSCISELQAAIDALAGSKGEKQ